MNYNKELAHFLAIFIRSRFYLTPKEDGYNLMRPTQESLAKELELFLNDRSEK